MSRSNSKRSRKNPFHKNQSLLRPELLEERALPSCNMISGFVYHDANNDGLYQPGVESPIANSTIELRDANNVVVGATTTDANGFYMFDTDQTQTGNTATKTEIVTFPTTATNFQLTQVLNQFDPSLGTLESIEITHSGSITSEIKVENFSGSQEPDIAGTVSGELTLTAPGVSNKLNPTAYAGSFHADQYDGVTDFTGTSGTSFGEQTADDSDTITLTGADLAAYIGTGQVSITESAVATSNATGGGNLDAQIRSKGASTVTVVYHYREKVCLAPGDYKIIQTTQPPTYFDGRESKQGTVIPNTVGTDFIEVTLADADLENNNFGELRNTQISGHVWHDANNDGVREASEDAIPGVTITLVGPNGDTQTTTDANGYYEFLDLDPGTYTLKETQPTGFLDGKDNFGTKGGTVVNDAAEDQIQSITLVAGDNSQDNDFGEIKPASLAGHVWFDEDNDGVRETGEDPIANVTIELTGFDDLGPVSKQMVTNADGEYKFADLRPGTYALVETQPANYADGQDAIGTPGGTQGNDIFSAINLEAGFDGVDNDFGEIQGDRPGDPLPKDVGPFGELPVISKVQLTAIPYTDVIDPTLRGQMAFIVGSTITLTGHQPNTAETLAGVAQLNAGVTPTQFVNSLIASDAHRAQQASSAYQDVLGRAPTAQETAAAIQALQSGTTELELKEQLFVSTEYGNLYPSTNELATALSRDILNVIPGTQAMQNLLQSMNNSSLNDVVKDLLTSDASLSSEIDDVYRAALRRPATTAEINTWLSPIKNGTMTLDELTSRLLSSQEFFQLAYANVN